MCICMRRERDRNCKERGREEVQSQRMAAITKLHMSCSRGGGEGEWPPAKRLKVKCREQLKAKWVKPSKSKLRRRRLHRYMKEQAALPQSRAVRGEEWQGVPRGFPFQLSFSVAQSMRDARSQTTRIASKRVCCAAFPSLSLSLSLSPSLFLSLSLPLLLLNWFAFLVSQI